MTCREAGPLLHARLDNELDMASSASIDLHLSECRACAAQYADLESLHEEIAASDLAYGPGIALERKLATQFLGETKSPSRFWSWTWLNASVMAAAAIGVVVLILSVPMLRIGGDTDAIGAEILDNHLRALQAVHQVDVPSSDQHTVKPWFQGKTSFSPPVPDLTSKTSSFRRASRSDSSTARRCDRLPPKAARHRLIRVAIGWRGFQNGTPGAWWLSSAPLDARQHELLGGVRCRPKRPPDVCGSHSCEMTHSERGAARPS